MSIQELGLRLIFDMSLISSTAIHKEPSSLIGIYPSCVLNLQGLIQRDAFPAFVKPPDVFFRQHRNLFVFVLDLLYVLLQRIARLLHFGLPFGWSLVKTTHYSTIERSVERLQADVGRLCEDIGRVRSSVEAILLRLSAKVE